MIKVGNDSDGSILNILYGDNPFEHANRFNYVNLNFQKWCDLTMIRIINQVDIKNKTMFKKNVKVNEKDVVGM